MSLQTKAQLNSAASTVTTETVPDANNEARIGGLFTNLADSLMHAALLQFLNAQTPAQITANQNDYAVTQTWNRVSSDAARNITGVALTGVAAGHVAIFENVGSFALTFVNASASSAAANRFSLAADLVLGAGKTCAFLYDGTLSRWVLLIPPRTILSDTNPVPPAAVASPGTADEAARRDHVHQFGPSIEVAEQATPLANPAANSGKFAVLADGAGTIQRPGFRNDAGVERVLAPFPTEVDAARQTTDATVTTALTIAVPDNTVLSIGVRWKARQTGGSANFGYKNLTVEVSRVNAGVATIMPSSQKDGASLLPGGWGGVTVDVDGGNNARVRVAGAAATTINHTVQCWTTSEALP